MNKVYECVEELMHQLDETQEENINAAAKLFAESLKAGGMLQAFGSGHSQAGASELCFRFQQNRLKNQQVVHMKVSKVLVHHL